ncbi:MAG: thiamine phosphate synthase YjbQ (UPF0047 family) [Paraglaciecola sp.]|jgi:thiamine phosphate synthase YjbQ (UPF0047 family)
MEMFAHLKISLSDNNLTIPIRNWVLALDAWQRMYLRKHKNNALGRYLIVTVTGQ